MKLGLLASAWLVGTIIGLRLDPAVLPLILLGTLGASLGEFIHPLVGQIFGWLDWVPISYLMEHVARFPSFTVSGSWLGSWMVWPWYLALAVTILLVRPIGHLLRETSIVSRLFRLPVDRGNGEVWVRQD